MSEHVRQQADGEGRRSGTSRSARLSDETVESVAAMLRVLAEPTRIRMIEILNQHGRATVSALCACLPVTQQNVSKQLWVLHQAGIVRRRREGNWVHYELADWSGVWLIEQLAAALAADSDTHRG
ncbi:MAG TPA: metalloregulator ArsR/SmtB family transcription factor [Solirubrobacterales bacterium]|nr:metalloregulator ArsR/SmtB family transcription factor [Solirubrobacterales bacterium]